MIKATAKLILALNGNVKKSQIASGIAWGTLLGLIPAGNFFWIVIFIVSFFFRHNHGSKLFGMALVKIFFPLITMLVFRINPELHLTDALGWFILKEIDILQPIFTSMYNMPFVPFTNYNNTLVMGGIAGGLILWLPVFFISMLLIPVYRNHIASRIRNNKLVKLVAKSPFLKVIEKLLKD